MRNKTGSDRLKLFWNIINYGITVSDCKGLGISFGLPFPTSEIGIAVTEFNCLE